MEIVKRRVALVTDSSADLTAEVREESGASVVPVRIGYGDTVVDDHTIPLTEFYRKMRAGAPLPHVLGATEEQFTNAFAAALGEAETVLCLIAPFDTTSTFWMASKAAQKFERGAVKVLNPGVASAGLCSLITALAPYARSGQGLDVLLAAIDLLEPYCDTLFVPGSMRWLDRGGRRRAIEERVGEVGDGVAIVRVGTRFTGVSAEASHETAVERAVAMAGLRAGDGTQIIVTIAHADAPEVATQAADLMQRRWNVVRTIVTELSVTIGTQVGPGSIGIGVSPARPMRGD